MVTSTLLDKTGWFDFHCHLYNLYKQDTLESEIESAKKNHSIEFYISSALSAEEIFWHSKNNFLWTAGIHPLNEVSNRTSIEDIHELILSKRILAIGEIGLDKRNSNKMAQIELLKEQLDLATQYYYPVVFHVVGMDYDLIKILKYDFPKIRGVIHSFSSSLEVLAEYIKLGLGVSINYNINRIKESNSIINRIIKYGFFFIETDAPYQTPFNLNQKVNKLEYLSEIINLLTQNYCLDSSGLKNLLKKNLINFLDLT